MLYVGRFAPSPSGPLHFGSLVAALASYLDARARGGAWLLRIEDLDGPRARPEASDAMRSSLDRLGFEWDGAVLTQRNRVETYAAVLRELESRELVYPCACTRREMADSALAIDGARIYPGTCRNGVPPGRRARAKRMRTPAEPIVFEDRLQGVIRQSIEREVGDCVLLRADGIFSYQLAVVVDDAAQGVTDVVRGADLLDSTARQILLQRLLGYPQPRYLHVPVALSATGEKLSKQSGAAPIDAEPPETSIEKALRFLGHPPPSGLAARELLAWGVANWCVQNVPVARAMRAPG